MFESDANHQRWNLHHSSMPLCLGDRVCAARRATIAGIEQFSENENIGNEGSQ